MEDLQVPSSRGLRAWRNVMILTIVSASCVCNSTSATWRTCQFSFQVDLVNNDQNESPGRLSKSRQLGITERSRSMWDVVNSPDTTVQLYLELQGYRTSTSPLWSYDSSLVLTGRCRTVLEYRSPMYVAERVWYLMRYWSVCPTCSIHADEVWSQSNTIGTRVLSTNTTTCAKFPRKWLI